MDEETILESGGLLAAHHFLSRRIQLFCLFFFLALGSSFLTTHFGPFPGEKHVCLVIFKPVTRD